MIAFLKRIFGFAEPDLGRILASFRSTLAKLEEHVAYHNDAARKQMAIAADADYRANLHEEEASKAEEVFGNISKLVGAS
jgi:hypothetical protein